MLERRQLRARVRSAGHRLRARGVTTTVLMIWRPEFAYALDALPHDLSAYYLDDEYSFSEDDAPVGDIERRVLETVGQVFIHSPGLLEKKGSVNPHTLAVPNGVDFAAFADPRPVPADLAAVPAPRIGYVGRIKPQLDWSLIGALSVRHPEWSFVFVGPPANRWLDLPAMVGPLASRPNVHWLGSKPVEALPAYLQHFTVSILPYRRTGYTRYIYPLKLHESLAAGVPVVGSPIRTLEDFADVVALAGDVEEWERALTASVAADARDAARVEARRAVARRHDWDDLASRVARAMAERLGPGIAGRLRRAGGP
jgi:glycosyltransferase involved in cell wall biosynthesis